MSVALFGLGLGLSTAVALDGTRSPANPASGRAVPGYSTNLREWFHARELGEIETTRKLLEDAAGDGDVGAAWKLGRMHADGDGVERDHQRAFEYFSGIATSHADEVPGTKPAVFVAKAFVEIGRYYLTGIANYIKPDAVHAHKVFSHAASYFGDPDAQYHLGRMYLDGHGVSKDMKQESAGCRLRRKRANIRHERFWAVCCSRANPYVATARTA